MFMIIALVCSAGASDPMECQFVYSLDLQATYEDCEATVAADTVKGEFRMNHPTTGQVMDITEHYCVDWSLDPAV